MVYGVVCRMSECAMTEFGDTCVLVAVVFDTYISLKALSTYSILLTSRAARRVAA
jgi:hypothetical protein